MSAGAAAATAAAAVLAGAMLAAGEAMAEAARIGSADGKHSRLAFERSPSPRPQT